jgi:hypothetical protein
LGIAKITDKHIETAIKNLKIYNESRKRKVFQKD